jgi:hypothetical protein
MGSCSQSCRSSLPVRSALQASPNTFSICAFLSVKCLLTEDLQADQDLDGVLAVNPFLCDPDWLLWR